MSKKYYLYVNGQKVKVSEQIYKVYWREKEHEKYLEQVDRKNHLFFFSSLDHDGHFAENIADQISLNEYIDPFTGEPVKNKFLPRCQNPQFCSFAPRG
ncbi:hypothetical protein L0P32_19350, partial [[Clostridium] scindens]|nr:hypothetical protein [[Clostridium] scindens]MCG4930952.1 hypothetical protein [[Clostridium] scindens]